MEQENKKTDKPENEDTSPEIFQDCMKYVKDVDAYEPMRSEENIDPSDKSLNDRDVKYTEIMDEYKKFYKKKSDSNILLREKFFSCSFALLFILVIGMIVVSVILCFAVENVITIGVGMVSTIAASVTSILLLPRIIGEYLFPKDEDEHITNLIKDMRINDEHRRDNKNHRDENNFQKHK